MMRRRDFITLLGGAAAAWPLAARAQEAKPRTIGFMGASAGAALDGWVAAFVQRLRELGWVEGRNVAIEYRWAEGQFDRLPGFAAEFVRRGVDIIVAEATVSVAAAEAATAAIPIVFPVCSDPVGNKLVASLARPGGNATGLSIQTSDLGPKRIELLREIIPGLKHLAVMVNPKSPTYALESPAVEAAARALGIEVSVFEYSRVDDIPPAFQHLTDRAEAIYVAPDPTAMLGRSAINALALYLRLATMFAYRDHVESGGLISYGPSVAANFRRAAEFVDRILHGAKPGDIPVEQPTKYDLVINLKTAKAIGLNVPPSLLARADEVIE
jgi:putative ABC transport system substrate-binding protein